MVQKENARQKKLAKKKAKEQQRRKAAVASRQRLMSAAGQLSAASHGEVTSCHIGDAHDREVNGMVAVLLVREARNGQIAFANFLVDLWCLGVKDCAYGVTTRDQMDEMLESFSEAMTVRRADPSTARAVVEAGVEYARSLGLSPHPDYKKGACLWGDIERGDLPAGFEMGRDGVPFYVAGPYDSDAKQRAILSALSASVGEGNYDFMVRAEGLA